MLHCPHAEHGGSPFAFEATRGTLRGFFFLRTNQPFFGRLTLGIGDRKWPFNMSLVEIDLERRDIEGWPPTGDRGVQDYRGRRIWTLLCGEDVGERLRG